MRDIPATSRLALPCRFSQARAASTCSSIGRSELVRGVLTYLTRIVPARSPVVSVATGSHTPPVRT
jgi:hypothetical protein